MRTGELHRRLSIALVALLLVAAHCPVQNAQLPTAVCPEAQQPPVPPPATPPPWQRAGKAGLELSLRGLYVQALLRARLQKLLDASGDKQASLTAVRLEERGAGGQRRNVVAARFAVLLQKQDGTTEPLPGRNYTLVVSIVPQLVTPVTFPDAATRSALLCGGAAGCGASSGVVLNFYFDELDGGPNFIGARVDCKASGYDVIDEAVLAGAQQVATLWAPLPIPVDGLLQFVGDLTQTPVSVVGVDLGTDQDLKLALALDRGAPPAFDPSYTQFSRHDADWLLSFDTSLLAASLSANVLKQVRTDPTVVPTTPTVRFSEPEGIDLRGGGSKPVGACGSVPFSFEYVVRPTVCKRGSTSVFTVCTATREAPTPHYASVAQEACVGLSTLFSGLFSSGLATAVIGSPCVEKTTLNLRLDEDSLYAIGIDLDNQFLVVGRSQLVDGANASRTPMPTSCP